MRLLSPYFLLLLPLAAAGIWYFRKKHQEAALPFSAGTMLADVRPTWKVRASAASIVLRYLAVGLCAVALSRPQTPVADSKIETEGIDIVLALDSSTSMLAEDFMLHGKRQNRIEIIKDVVRDFIRGRKNDRIGVVAFAARAYTLCPLTIDYTWLLENVERLNAGMLEDGTAIGSGIASSVNRLRTTKAKSKVIILLTDGRNNTGTINPQTAAEAAKAMGVKVYTIGAGSKGRVPYPARDFFGRKVYQMVELDLDEETLQNIAATTGGRYFRATDTETLRHIYRTIDAMEKTPLEQKGYLQYNEHFGIFLLAAFVCVLLEIVLSNTVLRKIP